MQVSEDWAEVSRRRAGDSSGGAGRLFGEVCDEVLRGDVGWRVKMVLLGGTGIDEVGVAWERLAEFVTEELGVAEEGCGGLGRLVLGDNGVVPGTRAAIMLDICRSS